MTLPEEIKEYLSYIVQSVKVAVPVKDIYLFGSYADGTYRSGKSDLDIYIVTADKSKRQIDWALEADESFDRKLRIPIDLYVNYLDTFEERCKMKFSLEYEVAKKGISLNAI